MKSLGTLLQLIIPFCTITCFGQSSFAGKIKNAASGKPSMDIVLFMFGMENPVKVGETDKAGNITISFPKELPASISAKTRESFAMGLPEAFYFSCDGSNDFSKEIRNITAYKGGFFSLSHTGQLWEGTIFPVLK